MKALLIVVLFSVSCSAQNMIPAASKKAPELKFRELLQAPSSTPPTLAALQGKAVVMEFWATWCGGCVAAIPHLNTLANQVKGKPVIFLSVTDEDPAIVQTFLKKRPMSGWIGIDNNGATFARYGILGRPQTILIDRQGILRLRTEPEQVNAALIDKLISGKPLTTDAKQNTPPVLPMELVKGVPPPLMQVLIRPAAPTAVSGNSPGAVVGASGGRIEYYGVTLRTLLYYAEQIREDRIVAPPWFDQDRYDASTIVPRGRSDLRHALLQQALTETFSLKMHRESKPASVYVLTSIGGSEMHLSHAKESPGFRTHAGQFTGVATSVSRLTQILGSELDRVEVIDETGLTGLYNFDLAWQKGNLESLQAALRDQLGLNLRKEVRNREFLVVAQATQPTTW